MVYTVFDKKTSDTNRGTGVSSGIVSENKELAKQLLKPIVRKFEKKLHSPFIDSNRGAHLADMQLLSKCNKEIDFLLYAIDIFDKNASAVLLKDKKKYHNY